MPPARSRVAVITDEIAPALDDAIAFAAEEGLGTLEVRQLDERNFMMLSPTELAAVRRRLDAAGITVSGLATPLLKWPGPGQPCALTGDQFGFDPKALGIAESFRKAFEAADILGTRRLRIFTYLAYRGYSHTDLSPALEKLLALAERQDCLLLVENEPVCNVATVAELAGLMRVFGHPRLRALLDLGNAYASGTVPSAADLAAVAPWVDTVHVKDYAIALRRFVPLGEGDIPFEAMLRPVLAARPGDVRFSVETHAPERRMEATRASLRATRALLERLGAPPGA